jgi:hypothetical protein
MAVEMKAFAVLGVAPGATVAEIKTAYRERARQIHPDRFAADPRRARAAHEAFVELSAAFRTALAATAAAAAATAAAQSAAQSAVRAGRAARTAQVRSGRPSPVVPVQRNGSPASATGGGARPPSRTVRPTVTPIRQDDPMLTLLTVPQRCARPWSAHALEVWALTVVPEARRHLSEARRIARAGGVRLERHLTTATAHVLLTLTVNGLNGPRVMGVATQLDAAYDTLEIVLPREVVDRLPARVTTRRPEVEAPAQEQGSRLLAFCAAGGAFAAITVWTEFFGFFAG